MSIADSVAKWIWHGEGAGSAAARAALWPAERLYEAVVKVRNARFDAGHGVHQGIVPALSVGNLTVGGTGKTPVAAWCARTLREMGAKPAMLLRGYGDDEWRVHQLLNPAVPVVTDSDRVRGLEAIAASGEDCAVLDDAFQHRRAARISDLVLISADSWTGSVRLLPAGPWREALPALRRATVAVITVKAADEKQVADVSEAIARSAPEVPVAVVEIRSEGLRAVAPGVDIDALPERIEPLSALAGQQVVVASAIGVPEAFEQQISATGARIIPRRFRDHHAYSPADVSDILAGAAPSDVVVCTLKDAVKLAPLWPREAPALLYVSQTIEVRRGLEALHDTLVRVVMARNLPQVASRLTAG